MKLKDKGIDTSIEDAMRVLERLKAVHIAVGKDDEIQIIESYEISMGNYEI